MKQIQVGLGDRAYDILISEGLISGIGPDLETRSVAKRYAVISDDHVAGLFGNQLMDSLKKAGVTADLITFPEGEASKNLSTISNLASRLARMGFDRKDGLIALGGGVTGDITGFLAAVYMRGIPFIQVATTLLAQVDSSVGGKTGVDIPEGKNLVGAFYQPACVYIDSSALVSLPRSELLNGMAEVIKYGVIYDADFFQFLEQNREAILGLDLKVMEDVIQRCCAIKARVVEADERESDLRRILNFGHTIGHAVEAASDYSMAHGLCVAMGMAAAGELAVAKSIFSNEEAERLSNLITGFGLSVTIPKELDRARIREYLKTDKKAVSGKPFFILPTTIGEVIITDDVSKAQINQVIR